MQATYLGYQREYGSREKALEMMAQEYGQNIPTRNLHFIMGTMANRQWQSIVIGLLRSGLDPQELSKRCPRQFPRHKHLVGNKCCYRE